MALARPPRQGQLHWHPDTGRSIRTAYQESPDGTSTIVHSEDVSAVLEDNKRAFNDADRFKMRQSSWHHAARVPVSVIHQWKVLHGVDILDPNHDVADVHKLLRMPAYKFLRRSPLNYEARPSRMTPTTHKPGVRPAMGLSAMQRKIGAGNLLRAGAFGAS